MDDIQKYKKMYEEDIADLSRQVATRETWIQQLRDDNKQLREDLLSELEQVKKDKQYWIDLYDEGDGNLKREVESLRSELDQVKIERDAWKESSKDQFSELFLLRDELSQFGKPFHPLTPPKEIAQVEVTVTNRGFKKHEIDQNMFDDDITIDDPTENIKSENYKKMEELK